MHSAGDKLTGDLRLGSYGPYGLARIAGRVPVVVEVKQGHPGDRASDAPVLHLLIAPEELLDLAALDCVASIEIDRGARE